jgi:glycosyltransferase involved in cell wall biosynthesis
MKIVMVSHYFESHRGGVEIVAGQLARAFTALGHRLVWMACDSTPPPTDPAVCERCSPLLAYNGLERRSGLPYPVPLPRTSGRFSNEICDSDVVLIHDGSYLPCLLAQRTARRTGKPVVMIQHIGSVPYRNPLLRLAMATLNRLCTTPALTAAAQVVFISELTRLHFVGVPYKRPPVVLHNGVDSAIFGPAPAGTNRRALRQSNGLNPDRPMALFVGRFVEKKGLIHLERMARLRPEWDWVLAGWGPVDPMRWRLPNVRVFSDRSGASLAALYHAADALVLPSVGEGYPLVVQEALACGLPVVCGDDTAAADPAAQAFLAGVRVLTNDPDATAGAFVGALGRIIEAPDLAETGRRVRADFARERYSWERMASRMLSIFASI